MKSIPRKMRFVRWGNGMPTHAGTLRELEAVPGVENPKIRPRRKKISVIHSNEESDRLETFHAVYLSVAFGDIRHATEIFLRSGWRFLDFGVGLAIRCSRSLKKE